MAALACGTACAFGDVLKTMLRAADLLADVVRAAAATILGDGRVALIDVDAVIAGSRAAAPGFEQLCAAAG